MYCGLLKSIGSQRPGCFSRGAYSGSIFLLQSKSQLICLLIITLTLHWSISQFYHVCSKCFVCSSLLGDILAFYINTFSDLQNLCKDPKLGHSPGEWRIPPINILLNVQGDGFRSLVYLACPRSFERSVRLSRNCLAQLLSSLLSTIHVLRVGGAGGEDRRKLNPKVAGFGPWC